MQHYAPYGEVWGEQGAAQTPFGFTGEPTDQNGLVHLRARYYNPTLGVFPNLDPMKCSPVRPMSLNHYGYVQGNPINMVDPSGMIGERPSNSCSQQSPTCVGPAYEVCKAACEVTSYADSSIMERCTQNCCNTLNNIPSGPCVGGIVGDLMPSSEAATFIKSCNLGWLYIDKPNFLFSGDVVVAFSGVTSMPNAFITEVTYGCYDTPSESRTRIAANTYTLPCSSPIPATPTIPATPSGDNCTLDDLESAILDSLVAMIPGSGLAACFLARNLKSYVAYMCCPSERDVKIATLYAETMCWVPRVITGGVIPSPLNNGTLSSILSTLSFEVGLAGNLSSSCELRHEIDRIIELVNEEISWRGEGYARVPECSCS